MALPTSPLPLLGYVAVFFVGTTLLSLGVGFLLLSVLSAMFAITANIAR